MKCGIQHAGASSSCPACGVSVVYPSLEDCGLRDPIKIRVNFFRLVGRDSVKQLWKNCLIAFGVALVGLFIEELRQGDGPPKDRLDWFGFLVFGAFYWLVFASTVRRFHDLGKSGLEIILLIVPIYGLFLLYDILCTPGKTAPNIYGFSEEEVKSKTQK